MDRDGGMISKTQWQIQNLLRKLWVRAALIGLLGVAAAFAAQILAPLIPPSLSSKIGAEAADQILGILASSMLAVVTFSLSIAVMAFANAAKNATPRATRLLQQDGTTQNVLATFIGAFLYSLVSIIGLNAGIYGAQERLVLFVTTIAVVALVVMALLRWISHLTDFGRMDDTLNRVEAAATNALRYRAENPFMGGKRAAHPPPDDAIPIYSQSIGYVQHIDVAAIAQCGKDHEAEIWLAAVPGSFAHPAQPLVHVKAAELSKEAKASITKAFTCNDQRSFDQDPRFGLIVLSEIASRALSPAVNDPGTAIDILGRLVRVLSIWNEQKETQSIYPHIYVPPIEAVDLMEDAFQPVARDGAAMIEVQIRLHKALQALAAIAPDQFAKPAKGMAEEALERARKSMALKTEIERLEEIAARMNRVGRSAAD